MELTKQERKLAEVAAKNYHRFFYRRSEIIGWIGVPIFALGILPFFSLPHWLDITCTFVGALMVIFSCFGVVISALGKLYTKANEQTSHSDRDKIEG